MRVFVAGASGALGSRLVPQLIDAGHEVIGTYHSPASAQLLQVLGAEPVRLDLLDARAVHTAVLDSRPDAIVHQATALADVKFGRSLDKTFAVTNRLRTEGTDALLAAASEAGVRRFVAQSFAPFLYARQGGPVKTEADPVDQAPLRGTSKAFAAITHLEKVTTDFGGIVLRYGGFYGAANDALVEPVRKRQFPVVGDGGGIFSWLHLDDGAAATVLAEALGAKPPRHVPAWLARLIAGSAAVEVATQARGSSNAKAKRELGWTLRYPSWRTGFPATYSAIAVADGQAAGQGAGATYARD